MVPGCCSCCLFVLLPPPRAPTYLLFQGGSQAVGQLLQPQLALGDVCQAPGDLLPLELQVQELGLGALQLPEEGGSLIPA